ncbi:hypothetical protein XENOCAPTIV_004403 [Xenoophorus captivus]|uniref:PAS domain-containing protein n=1 Tax=Xenoophorus captivus TaxID=1517983 RepID=A0ABV0RQZ4_9TELE
MLLMNDQSAVMSGGDSGQDGEEPALPSGTAENEGADGAASGHQDGHTQLQHLAAEGRGALTGEVGQEDEEMTSASNDLSSSANESPGSARGCPSPSTKSSELDVRGRGHAHREVMSTVAEMKKRLPSDKRSHSKVSTVEALNYALNCVKQVQANSEYYKLLMQNGQDQRKDDTVCTLEELERVTSEHNLKNTDSFVVVFSLSSGRVLYASDQAPSLLCCKRKYLESAKFVELLFHQDVNVFYTHTAQPHLPPWSNSHSAGVLFDSAQVKSFFVRIRGSKDREGEMRYNPFRVTPYLLKVQGTGGGKEEEPCCLASAERIISGYEAPRIPMDKRIFTTTHSPGCVFLEVDDRAVPLLGYMPQDLIGTSLLTCIHPEDRPLMLSMHRQILKYAGQPPFEHSPVRLQCQNGDYVTLDTSWSSFINPWSRKVAFIIGRHKVRTSPLNEDVFAARTKDYVPVTYEEIKDLQAKIYKLFLQKVKAFITQVFVIDFNQRSTPVNIFSPHLPVVVLVSEVSVGPAAAAVVGAPLTDITMSSKAMSVVSVTSQCSYSSTIVHVPQPESEATALEDAPMGSEPVEPAPTPVRPTLSSATEERMLVGLTKEVLSAHTQKEEQEYVDRFRHRILQSPYSSYLQQENGSMAHSHQPGMRLLLLKDWLLHKRPKPQGSSDSYASPAGPTRPVPYSSWPSSESSQPQMAETYSQTSPVPVPFFPVLGNPGTEQPRPQPLPAAAPAMLQPPEQLSYNFNVMPSGQSQPTIQPVQMEPMQNFQNFYSPLPLVSPQSFNPYVAPVMAIILPSYPNLTPGFPSMPSAVLQGSSMITGYAPGSASFPHPQFQVQTGPHTQTSPGLLLCSQKATSSVGEEEETAGPQALFSSSRSSSPLQLNLLQEELPKLSEGQSSTGLNHSESLHEQHAIEVSLNLFILL